ncbi:hypothetical protein H8E77_12015 [bacterium]|nr:hypothetical protein [bacterium]
MAGKRDIAKVKKVLWEGLKKFAPEVIIEHNLNNGYLYIRVISDAFEKYRDMQRMEMVGEVLYKAFAGDAIYSTIISVLPLTKAEYEEWYAPIPSTVSQ